MTNPSDRSPDGKYPPLVEAFAEYVRVLEAAQRSDGSDLTAHLYQLIEAITGALRAMHAGTFSTQLLERVHGPQPEPPADRSDPIAEAQYQDDLARWVMQAWQIKCEVLLKPFMGNDPTLDALHNDADRGLAGNPLQFFRPVVPQHGNRRDVIQHTARDGFVFTVLLAEAELDGTDRIKRVLDNAGIGISTRAFSDMRQNVADKTALDRIVAETKRRRDSRRGRQSVPMATVLITGPLGDAEQIALYPERYPDLAPLGTAEARIRHLFSLWSRGS